MEVMSQLVGHLIGLPMQLVAHLCRQSNGMVPDLIGIAILLTQVSRAHPTIGQ